MQMETVALLFFVEKNPINTGCIPKPVQEKRDGSSFKKAHQEFQGYQTQHNHKVHVKNGLSSSISNLDEGWISPSPLLCLSISGYLVSEIAVKLRLALLTSSQASPATPLSSSTTTNGLGKIQKTTAFSVQYQTLLSTQKLHQPFNRNHKPERFITCLHFPSADEPVNSRTNSLHN